MQRYSCERGVFSAVLSPLKLQKLFITSASCVKKTEILFSYFHFCSISGLFVDLIFLCGLQNHFEATYIMYIYTRYHRIHEYNL